MDLSNHLEKAAEAVKRRNYPFAVSLYGKLLALQPDNGDARAGLRQALYKRAEAKKPSKVFAWLGGGVHRLTAVLARSMGKHAAAARAYERFLVLDPLDEGANLKLGDSLQRAGHRRSALAVFQSYAQTQPRCLEAARRAGELLYEQGRMDEALAMYEQALKIDPRDQESLKARKNLAAEGALRTSGIETARSSRELIKDIDAHRKQEKAERLQLSAEEIEAELSELEEKLAETPDDVRLLTRVATLREMSNDVQGALDLLERVVQLVPNDTDKANKAGDLRLRLQERRVQDARKRGDLQAAERAAQVLSEQRVAEYRRRVQQHPTDLGLRFELGSALLVTGQLDEAIAELQQAVKDPRRQVEALLLLGRAFRGKGMAELALGQLEKALEASGGTGKLGKEVLWEMGAVTEESGESQRAITYYSRILEQDIGFRDVAKKIENLRSRAS